MLTYVTAIDRYFLPTLLEILLHSHFSWHSSEALSFALI